MVAVEVMFFWASWLVVLLTCVCVCECAVDWRCRLSVYPSSSNSSIRGFPPVALVVIFVILTPMFSRGFQERRLATLPCVTLVTNFLLLRFLRHISRHREISHRKEKVFPPVLPHSPLVEGKSFAGVSFEMEGFSSLGGGFPTDATHTGFIFFCLFLG